MHRKRVFFLFEKDLSSPNIMADGRYDLPSRPTTTSHPIPNHQSGFPSSHSSITISQPNPKISPKIQFPQRHNIHAILIHPNPSSISADTHYVLYAYPTDS